MKYPSLRDPPGTPRHKFVITAQAHASRGLPSRIFLQQPLYGSVRVLLPWGLNPRPPARQVHTTEHLGKTVLSTCPPVLCSAWR